MIKTRTQITYNEYIKILPLPRKTLQSYKLKYGKDYMIFLYEIFKTELPLKKKKQLFYNENDKMHEIQKDRIWNIYIDYIVLEEKTLETEQENASRK